jgi:phage gpG-like protein
MSTIHVEWSPDPIVFGEAIIEAASDVADLTLPIALAAQEVQADIRERFETETGPDWEPWQPWSESYAPKAEAYPNIGILQRDGTLAEEAENAVIINDDTVFFDEGQIPPYGPWHQTGIEDRVGKGGIPNPLPARPFLGLTEDTVIFIYGVFTDWFDQIIEVYNTKTGRMGRRHARRGIHPGTGHAGFIPRDTPMAMRVR